MEWVVGIQIDADARIVYVHMDDLKRCAPPDPEPTWPDAARGTSIVVSTRAPSTFALSDIVEEEEVIDPEDMRALLRPQFFSLTGARLVGHGWPRNMVLSWTPLHL